MQPTPRRDPSLWIAALCVLASTITGCSLLESASSPDAGRIAALTASPSLTPLGDGLVLSPRITHPYFPLSESRFAELHSPTDSVVRVVQPGTKTIGGVECLVLIETEFIAGDLREVSFNYFAQDIAGNVYYFGEDVDDYTDGKVTGHKGAWLVGTTTDEPTLFMPAEPKPGFRFQRENAPPAAQEWALVEDTDGWIETPAGEFWHVLVIAESNNQTHWQERKYYTKGIGLVSENGTLNLTSYSSDDHDEDDD